uniref:Uncharacterized protein n=1 Tax=Amphimedon queenslandica TaxID=400682 RepID=A0A1X7U7W4_AMPQE
LHYFVKVFIIMFEFIIEIMTFFISRLK